MTKAYVRFSTALAAAAMVATPALAKMREQPLTVIAPADRIHTQRVSYRDLDLRDSAAVALLKARVDAASLEVCNATRFATLLDMVERSNCIANARIKARPQIAAAVARAASGQQVALATAIQVSAAL